MSYPSQCHYNNFTRRKKKFYIKNVNSIQFKIILIKLNYYFLIIFSSFQFIQEIFASVSVLKLD